MPVKKEERLAPLVIFSLDCKNFKLRSLCRGKEREAKKTIRSSRPKQSDLLVCLLSPEENNGRVSALRTLQQTLQHIARTSRKFSNITANLTVCELQGVDGREQIFEILNKFKIPEHRLFRRENFQMHRLQS